MAKFTQTQSEIQSILNNAENITIDSTSVKIGNNAGINAIAERIVAIGSGALSFLTEAEDIVAIGYNALSKSTAGSTGDEGRYNVAIGSRAGENSTDGHHNTFVGFWCGKGNTTGHYNTFVGEDAGLANSTGKSNCIMGVHASFKSNSDESVVIGAYAGTELTSGERNVLTGYLAGNALTTGSQNIFIGWQAGAVTPYDGNPTTDYRLILIGAQSTTISENPVYNAIAIGYKTYIEASNTVNIGNKDITDVYFGRLVDAPRPKVHVGMLNISNMPTSAEGLESGDVWLEGTNFRIVT